MLGLQVSPASQASGASKRKPPVKPPPRSGPVWVTVQILSEHVTTPQVQCKNCDAKPFSAGATRIEDHICDKCTCDGSAFLKLKDELLEKRKDQKAAKILKGAITTPSSSTPSSLTTR